MPISRDLLATISSCSRLQLCSLPSLLLPLSVSQQAPRSGAANVRPLLGVSSPPHLLPATEQHGCPSTWIICLPLFPSSPQLPPFPPMAPGYYSPAASPKFMNGTWA
ncbi:hypothetical protein XELAEV_18010532mg [Xenopus laevis]|uniref:Uncharacterized protein n=1 Tax=Xenopus laevis TaxID=8355 RepID=A0A974DWK8_XENLA|nr:hypothetical protein XELAEV_18010532mg [Xenopus laevis]